MTLEYQTQVGTTFTPGTTPEQAAATDTLADLRYVHWDLLSVRLVTDGNGNQVDTQSHDAFGGEMDGGGEVPPFFTTYDREMTELDYARARYYRSNHRRFTSPDRYRGSYRRGSPQSLNRYAYVGNDPINRVDPTGHLCVWVQVSETYGYYDCSILVNNAKQFEPVDPPPPPPEPCKPPSWDKLNHDIRDMVGSERMWNQMNDEQKKALLAVAAKMIATGLIDFFDDLRVRWCAGGGTAADFGQNCGIGYGHVFFTGNELFQAFWASRFPYGNPYFDPNSPFYRFFINSEGLSQWNHPGFPLGARENTAGTSLHLSFTDPFHGPLVIEAHIDRYGPQSLFEHLRNEVFGEGVSFGEIWNALLNDPNFGGILKTLLDCPQPSGGGNPR